MLKWISDFFKKYKLTEEKRLMSFGIVTEEEIKQQKRMKKFRKFFSSWNFESKNINSGINKKFEKKNVAKL